MRYTGILVALWSGLLLLAQACSDRPESDPSNPSKLDKAANPKTAKKTQKSAPIPSKPPTGEGEATDEISESGLRCSVGEGGERFEIVIEAGIPHRGGMTKAVKLGASIHKGEALGTAKEFHSGLLVQGRELILAESELRLGEQSYGFVELPLKIEIKPDGVFVNGEFRGDLMQ